MAASITKIYFYNIFRLSEKQYRLLYNVIAALGLILILLYQFTIDTRLLFLLKNWMWILLALTLLPGLLIMINIIIKYFRQMSGLSNQGPELETTGLHKYVRHPLYAGTFLFIIGLFILMPTLANLVSVIVIIAYTLIAIRFEEKKLVNVFGEAYRDYQRKVPMIIPALKR